MGPRVQTKAVPATKQKTYSMVVRGWYRLTRGVVSAIIRLLSRFKVLGLEYVPADGPYLITINHLHWLDPPLLMVGYPHRAHVFTADKWGEHKLFGPLFRSLDAIFVTRGEVDRQALRAALAVLNGGGVMGMAPEGTRSGTGGLQEARDGAAYMAYRAGVPVLPVVAFGHEKAVGALRRLRRQRIYLVFGPPVEPPPVAGGGKAGSEKIHAFTEEIIYRMAAMLPPQYRGVYADVEEKRPDLVAAYGPDDEQISV